MHLTKVGESPFEGRQAGTIETYKGRGVWVPRGFTAAEIMEAAWVLERRFDVAPFVSRLMAEAALTAARDVSESPLAQPKAAQGASQT